MARPRLRGDQGRTRHAAKASRADEGRNRGSRNCRTHRSRLSRHRGRLHGRRAGRIDHHRQWARLAVERQDRDLRRAAGDPTWPYVSRLSTRRTSAGSSNGCRTSKARGRRRRSFCSRGRCFLVSTLYGWRHRAGPVPATVHDAVSGSRTQEREVHAHGRARALSPAARERAGRVRRLRRDNGRSGARSCSGSHSAWCGAAAWLRDAGLQVVRKRHHARRGRREHAAGQ